MLCSKNHWKRHGRAVVLMLSFWMSCPAMANDLSPRGTAGDSVPLDISRLTESSYAVNYILPDDIDQMVMPFLWPRQGALPDSPAVADYALVQGAIYDVYDGGDLAQIRQGADTWTSVSDSAFEFNEVSFDGNWGLGDGSNEIGWLYNQGTWSALGLPAGAIGVTYSFGIGDTKTEFDILLNGIYFYWYADSADPWYGPQYQAMHAGHINIHELGHAAGLKDLYNPGQGGYQSWMGSGNETVTMYGYAGAHEEDMTLSWVDEAALRLAYPVPEPAMLGLLGTAALAVLRRRRTR